jgi:hypothetical protein
MFTTREKAKLMDNQQKRGVGRPSLGKERMYFTLSKETVEFLHSLPAGDRSKYVDEAIKARQERERLRTITNERE